jgi:PBSX family phage terminase large subunit
MSEAEFVCHSEKQEQLIFSDYRETYAITGIQWAKTTSGAWWLKRHMFTHTDKTDAFIVGAPNYKIMNQSTLPAFKKIMDGFGEYKAGPAEFHMNNGGICYMRTGTDPDSVVGITNVRAVWGDEAGKFSRLFWENLLTRASFRQAPAMFTSTPYAMNWLYKDVLKPWRNGDRPDVKIIQAKSCDNPYFPEAEYERRKQTMDPRTFNAMYNGEFEKMHGLVYDCFDEDEHTVEPFALPMGTRYFGGVDWGTTHPFVITVRAITPAGDHYQVSEFYKTGLTILDMIQVAKQLKQVWGIQTFYCDPAEPGYIEEFNRHGLSALKANNDIKRGIDLQYSLIKSGKFKLFRGGNPYTLDEVESYRYPEPKDLRPDQDDKEQGPVDQDNHTMDTWRYVTNMTFHTSEKKEPTVPGLRKRQESNEQRIKRLKSQRNIRHTESW